ncbi:MAG: hypothetical protein WCE53_15425 [Candidatus Acidiferrum sp.]
MRDQLGDNSVLSDENAERVRQAEEAEQRRLGRPLTVLEVPADGAAALWKAAI